MRGWALAFAVILAACGNARITLRDGRTIDGTISHGDATWLYLDDARERPEVVDFVQNAPEPILLGRTRVARSAIRAVDHPGKIRVVAGLIISTLLTSAVVWSLAFEESQGDASPAGWVVVGTGLALGGGLAISGGVSWHGSKDRAETWPSQARVQSEDRTSFGLSLRLRF